MHTLSTAAAGTQCVGSGHVVTGSVLASHMRTTA